MQHGHEKMSPVDAAWLRMDSPSQHMVINAVFRFADALKQCGHVLPPDLVCNALAFMTRQGRQAQHDA